MLRSRYVQGAVQQDLDEKMVFVAGPRQVGKTTMARQILDQEADGVYLTWDRREDRREIREARWPEGRALVVLDELHKFRSWKRWIKGEFDTYRERLRFLVTGSARMDVYRRGGDSLQGRYHHYRLHPFTVREAESTSPGPLPEPGAALSLEGGAGRGTVESILEFGGFPEPFLAQSKKALRRWGRERLDRFFREDVRDLDTVRDLSAVEVLADLIASRVASPLSLNALREDMEVSHRAVDHWVDVLERLYFAFRVRPFASRLVRSLKKRPKVYLWDYTCVEDPGPRFENLVANHLLKFCHFLQDSEGHDIGLTYLRDTQGREVDFLVTEGGRPWFAVEAKRGGTAIDPSLFYFKERLGIPQAFQVVLDTDRDFVKSGVRFLPARVFLNGLV